MTERQRMLAAIRGEIPDRLPWVPRLGFWHRAGLRRGTLPAELRDLDLMEIAERLGVGYYAHTSEATGFPDHGLGIANAPDLAFEIIFDGVDREESRHGNETTVRYRTPVGSIQISSVLTDEALDAGATIPWKTAHAVQEPRDLEVAGYIFSHLRVESRLEGFEARRQRVGEGGVVVAFASGSACPIQHIMKELMPVEQFFYALSDDPAAIARLADQIEPYYQQIKQAAADAPAEVVFLGGNYDDSITPPPFFRKYIQPALRDYAEKLHQKGKYLMTHTDGENSKLLPLYRDAGFDVADSVCPHPMTKCRLEDIREAFADRITIMGGIPSILLCQDSATVEQFRETIDAVVERYTGQSHFVLAVSDMVTADAEWDRLRYITEKVRSAG